jgi:uncharacterized protein YjbI with pentapeptide repeats
MFHLDSSEMMTENIQAGNREFLDKIIRHYLDICLENHIAESIIQLNLHSAKFEKVDFRGLKSSDLDMFDFTNCDISGSILDRASLEGLKKYLKDKKIHFSDLNIENADLSPIIIYNQKHGIRYYSYCNLDDLDLTNVSFANSNLTGVSFYNTNILNCNFLGAKNITPKMFTKSINFQNAKFKRDFQEDHIFKEKISVCTNAISNIINKPYKAPTYPLFSNMLDPIDTIRLDDPYYIKSKD